MPRHPSLGSRHRVLGILRRSFGEAARSLSAHYPTVRQEGKNLLPRQKRLSRPSPIRSGAPCTCTIMTIQLGTSQVSRCADRIAARHFATVGHRFRYLRHTLHVVRASHATPRDRSVVCQVLLQTSARTARDEMVQPAAIFRSAENYSVLVKEWHRFQNGNNLKSLV